MTSTLPHFPDNRLADGGEVVSLTRRPLLPPRSYLISRQNTHFCKKLWEELIPYSPLIPHGRHRNDASNNSSLPRLASNVRRMHRHSFSNSTGACIRCSANVFTKPLPSNEKEGSTLPNNDRMVHT
jgi:hypothetical protein